MSPQQRLFVYPAGFKSTTRSDARVKLSNVSPWSSQWRRARFQSRRETGTPSSSAHPSLQSLLLLWLVSALLCHSLATNRPPRSLPLALSSNTYGNCSCPQFSPAHPAQQITAFAGCQLTETSCKMQTLCSHLNHLAAFHAPLPSPLPLHYQFLWCLQSRQRGCADALV